MNFLPAKYFHDFSTLLFHPKILTGPLPISHTSQERTNIQFFRIFHGVEEWKGVGEGASKNTYPEKKHPCGLIEFIYFAKSIEIEARKCWKIQTNEINEMYLGL